MKEKALSESAQKPQVNIEFIEGDTSELTVFIHGLLGRGRNFRQHAQNLKPLSSTLLIDMPNHAGSAWTNTFSYVETAELIVNAIKNHPALAAAGSKIHLLGHSMGGKVAMIIALTYPELVKSLIVVDISPKVRLGSESYFTKLIGHLLNIDPSAIQSRSAANELLQEHVTDRAVRAFLLQNLARDTSGGFFWEPNLRLLQDQLEQVMGFPDTESATFRGPVLWLAGEKSNYVKPGDLSRMEELFPDVVPVTVANAGHWVHADNPSDFDQLVQEFVQVNSAVLN